MARTMSDEQEALVRDRVRAGSDYTMESALASVSLSDLLAELDAERAAHEEESREHVLALQRLGNGTRGWLVYGRIAVLEDELAALKTRLALAEDVCESCGWDWDDEFGGFDVYDHEALEEWRASKPVQNAQD